MTPETFILTAMVPALHLLPERMNTGESKALVLAICLQESRLQHRRQIRGPARGYPQFETAGIRGVVTHRASSPHAGHVCSALDIAPTVAGVYRAIEFNDVLAAAFSRLLLWTLPQPLPERDDAAGAWSQYIEAWRPGRPHPDTWAANHADAWAALI